MGQQFTQPEYGYDCSPPLRTPFTDMGGSLFHWDMGPCVTFNMDFYDCMEAYGHTNGKEKCKLYFQDFMECAHKYKQMKRVEIMRLERRKQYAKGLVGLGPPVKHFAKPPPDDAYLPDPLSATI